MILIKLKDTVDGFINWAITNYLSHPNEEDTWLYTVFHPEQTDKYKIYDQLKSILLRTKQDPRKLETRLMFDASRAELPTVHVHMPSESPVGGNFIGMGAQNRDLTELSNGQDFSYNYRKEFTANYDIIVTSNNPMEVVLLYEFMKKIFIAGADTLVKKFDNFNLSGKELLYDSTLMPNIFYRAISCKIEDEITVPAITSYKLGANNINFEGHFVGFDIPVEE